MDDSYSIWQMDEETLLRALASDRDGLTGEEAGLRRELYGPNELVREKNKPVWRIFLEQFANLTVIILIIAAVLSAVLDDVGAAAVILVVLVLNAIMGTVQTVRAQASLDSLRRMAAPTAKVLRDGDAVQIPGGEVTVGDVVLLEAGDAVCADGRLLECASLKLSESALTGESEPAEKDPAPLEGEFPLGDRKNMVFSGTLVTYGRGRFLVTSVGMDTEMGRIASLMGSTKEKKTPLQESLDRFGQVLSYGILIVCALIFALCVLVRQEHVLSAFLFAVAVAVAAIPESLAPIVTIVLGFGTRRMAAEHAIIRKLQAVEGLGSVSVICSDKTGTLTQNRMTVRSVYVGGRVCPAEQFTLQDPLDSALLRCALLCSDAEINEEGEVGDPTETALVKLGESLGVQETQVRETYPRLGELPFDSDRKMMSTVHAFSGGTMMVTKGAVDVILARALVTPEEAGRIEQANYDYSNQGLRVLAFACRVVDSPQITLESECQLNFLGLVAMQDPPRWESAPAVERCIEAGIRPIMITGDHLVTASAIAREIGILREGDEAVEGADIEPLTDEELQELVPRVSVYARVSPEHKIRIVRAWQQRGELVAMTGDGVNDAPALKQADIGVAMGMTGTEAAKEAAGMVLADDNFATIVKAVKNGRNVYANIRRTVQFLLSGNTAAILVVLYATLFGLPLPFAPVQLLFVNLLGDSLAAIALGLEPPRDDVMQERPRPRTEGILNRRTLETIVVEAAVIAAAVAGAFHIGLVHGGEVTARTMAFAVLCLGRLLHGFNCKSEKPVLVSRRLWDNAWLVGALFLGAALLCVLLVFPATASLLQATVLTPGLWLAAACLSLGSMLAIQLLKALAALVRRLGGKRKQNVTPHPDRPEAPRTGKQA